MKTARSRVPGHASSVSCPLSRRKSLSVSLAVSVTAMAHGPMSPRGVPLSPLGLPCSYELVTRLLSSAALVRRECTQYNGIKISLVGSHQTITSRISKREE